MWIPCDRLTLLCMTRLAIVRCPDSLRSSIWLASTSQFSRIVVPMNSHARGSYCIYTQMEDIKLGIKHGVSNLFCIPTTARRACWPGSTGADALWKILRHTSKLRAYVVLAEIPQHSWRTYHMQYILEVQMLARWNKIELVAQDSHRIFLMWSTIERYGTMVLLVPSDHRRRDCVGFATSEWWVPYAGQKKRAPMHLQELSTAITF